MRVLEYWVHVVVYEGLVLLGCGVVFLPVMLFVESLADGPLQHVLIAFVLPFMLVGLFGGPWIAHHSARLRVLEGEGFVAALVGAFVEGRLALSGLPGIGKLFAVRPRECRPFVRPDERRFRGPK